MSILFHHILEISMKKGENLIQDVTRNVIDGFDYCEIE